MVKKRPPNFTFKANSLILWSILLPLYEQFKANISVAYASVTSNHVPRTIFVTRMIFACKAEWSARRNFYVDAVLVVTSGYGPRTAQHSCTLMVWSNDSQDSTGVPYDARTGTVRAPQGNLQCFSYPMGPVRGPCRTRKGAVRHPCGHVRELIQPKSTKIRHGHHIWQYGPRTGCSRAVWDLKTRTGPVSL